MIINISLKFNRGVIRDVPSVVKSMAIALSALLLVATAPLRAATLSFSDSDFITSPQFSNVQTFSFSIEIQGGLSAGGSYSNPALVGVDYSVFGTLAATPSGFSAFNLLRDIGGAEFYNQGSSLQFDIAASADLSDGLQFSELAGSGTVFTFNGREVGTGRYHPALLQLNSDGTGSIRNSNNFGGINPGSMQMVDVDFGEEYITNLSFDPANLTLASAAAVVPLPAAAWLFGFAVLLLRGSRGILRRQA